MSQRPDVRALGRRRVNLATRVAAATAGGLAVVFGVAMAPHAPAAAAQQHTATGHGTTKRTTTTEPTTTRPTTTEPTTRSAPTSSTPTTTPLQPPAQPPVPATGNGVVGSGGS